MGGRTTPLLRFLLRATRPLHRDGYASLAARLAGLQGDLGAGFDTVLQRGQDEVRRLGGRWLLAASMSTECQLNMLVSIYRFNHLLQSSLTVRRCLYHQLFSAAGQPQLSAACCCSLDAVWFDAAHYPGVAAAGRTAAISAGDECCRFEVRRKQPATPQPPPPPPSPPG